MSPYVRTKYLLTIACQQRDDTTFLRVPMVKHRIVGFLTLIAPHHRSAPHIARAIGQPSYYGVYALLMQGVTQGLFERLGKGQYRLAHALLRDAERQTS